MTDREKVLERMARAEVRGWEAYDWDDLSDKDRAYFISEVTPLLDAITAADSPAVLISREALAKIEADLEGACRVLPGILASYEGSDDMATALTAFTEMLGEIWGDVSKLLSAAQLPRFLWRRIPEVGITKRIGR